jgi:heterodisulfide reductase subunit A
MSKKQKKETPQAEELRIGVFICDCGTNIAGHLDCKSVTDYATDLPGVVFTKENLYTCSEAGIVEIQDAIKEHHLNRVVVASCSPRTHQPLFASSCAQAGLNPYLFEMVNIRDQCSWVHMQNKPGGTEKAKDLVRMGVAKAAHLEPQDDIEAPLLPKVIVIGGGVAGLSAAEIMAGMGLEVILVEKEAQLGGQLNRIYRLGPEGVKASDKVAELIAKAEGQKNLTIHTQAQVTAMGGYIGNYDITIQPDEGDPIQEKVGCIVVATGAKPLVPEALFNYDGKRVITQMELEEQLRGGAFKAQSVTMIQCVGARCEERSYCSRICCMTAVKNALFIKEEHPETQIHILYRDMQMYGTEKEKMLWDARGKGIIFDVYDEKQPPEVGDPGVSLYQPLMGETKEIPSDLVVLSTPLVARDNATQLSQMMRVPLDQNNFFMEAHAKLRPLDFATDGLFICGAGRYPATVDEAQSQGLGVASRVGAILFKGKMTISANVAAINPETCVGCLGCLEMCPYDAIDFLPEQNICTINTILCKGCGCCAATCPSESVQLKGYKPKQMLCQIRAVCSQ